MFRKLHIHLTLFCTLVTGLIFLTLTVISLFFAETSIRKNSYASFLNQLNSVLIHLQEQESISHQWLNQLLEKGQLQLFLYDNGTPLLYQNYHDSNQERQLAQEAEAAARTQCNIDIFSQHTNQLTLHKEYAFTSSAGQEYYASAGVIPKKNGCLGILILSSLKEQQSQIQYLRFVVCLTGIAALFLLFLFSRSFIRRLIIPLEKSQKRQTHFIASASHELRAPLSVLRSGLEVLEKTEDPAKQAHTIALLQDEGLRMQNLIRDMLLLANSDSGELPLRREFWQPDSILLHVFENYEPLAAKKSIRLSIQIPEELLPNCCCDRERIIQVFSILLNNALSYTPEGGKIHLSLAYEKPFLAFRFTDTGCGISDREKHLIFDRFYRSDQAHSDREHFGLGLCIAKEIVTSHQGRIGVENNPTGGSCFYVKLPGRK